MYNFYQNLLMAQEANATLGVILLRLFLTLGLGIVVSLTYQHTTKKSYSKSLPITLAITPLIIATVLMALGKSIPSAFGLFAALSIIRFRTPIKDTREMVFIFLCIAAGICTGAGALLLAPVSILLICATIYALESMKYGDRHKDILQLHVFIDIDKADSIKGELNRILDKNLKKYSFKTLSNQSMTNFHFTYDIQVNRDFDLTAFVKEISDLGANDVLIQEPIISHS